MDEYRPSDEILEKYANVLVNCALGGGSGVKKGEVVFVQIPECAKPFYIALQRAIIKAGANMVGQYFPDGTAREYYELANEDQLKYFPGKLLKGRIDEIDHSIFIEAEMDKHELEGIDPKKLMMKQKAFKPYMEWRDEKEGMGKFTWTIALYGTEAMAKEAGLSLKEYWDQIIKACYLDRDDPVGEWKRIIGEIDRLKDSLNKLEIEKVHIKSEGTDLTVGLGKNRGWLGGTGRNIPSFEVFISPDYRLTNGYISIDQPLYRYGVKVEGIYLEFKDGEVVKATASKNENVLKEMIATDEGAKRIGEFSLTDVRMSRIDKFMAETLFDENFGGKYGNTHVALGKAYKDSYPGEVSKVSSEQWKEMGYNESAIHTDVVSTENREVYASLKDGREILIYKDGQFTV